MGFIDSFKRATAGLASLIGLGAKPSVTLDEVHDQQYERAVSSPQGQTYRRSTTASRRFQRDANRRYLHISKEIPEGYDFMVRMLGEREAQRWLRNMPGETYNIGINAVKRNIAALPKAERKEARRVFDRMLKDSGVK
ncbi:hypothetical protein [Xanthomonas phage SB4]|uniref:HK97 gp10 family phage protein n=1 Tax=Xanthomonas phage SB4 TaxID=3117473 RepID=A0ABZ2GWQ3_9CAUD